MEKCQQCPVQPQDVNTHKDICKNSCIQDDINEWRTQNEEKKEVSKSENNEMWEPGTRIIFNSSNID